MFIQNFPNNSNILFFLSLNIDDFFFYNFLGYIVKYSFLRGYTNEEEKPYNIFHLYSTASHVP